MILNDFYNENILIINFYFKFKKLSYFDDYFRFTIRSKSFLQYIFSFHLQSINLN